MFSPAALNGTTGGEIFLGPFSTTLLAPATYVQPTSTNTSGTQIQSGTLIIGTGGSLPSVSAGGTFRTNSVTLGTTAGLAGVLQLGDASGPVAQSINSLNASSATTSFNSDLVIGGAANISTLTIDNTAVATAGSPTQAGNTTFTGILGGPGANQNNLALTVNMLAANNVTLQNSNTYVGNTNVTGGALAIGSSTVPGSIVSPNVSVASGATFTVSQVGAISPSTNLTTNGTVNIRNAATTIKSLNGSGSLALSTSAITTTLTITNGGNYSGNISSDPVSRGNLAVSGGNLTLSGSNSYSGTTTVSAGTLALIEPNAWAPALNGPGNTILSGGKLVLDYTGNPLNDPINTIKGILNSAAYAANFATGQIHTSGADALHGIGWKDDTTGAEAERRTHLLWRRDRGRPGQYRRLHRDGGELRHNQRRGLVAGRFQLRWRRQRCGLQHPGVEFRRQLGPGAGIARARAAWTGCTGSAVRYGAPATFLKR